LSIYAGAIAILMVSRIRTFSGKRIAGRIERDYIAPVIALAGLFAAVLATYPYTTLTVGCLTYLAFIPIAMRHYWRTEQQMAALPAPALPHDGSAAPSPEKPPRHLHS
jgi:CDP-diacylglycerol--serine O-phosphatidyltransferase